MASKKSRTAARSNISRMKATTREVSKLNGRIHNKSASPVRKSRRAS